MVVLYFLVNLFGGGYDLRAEENDIDEFFNDHAYCNGDNKEEIDNEFIEHHNKFYDFPQLKHEHVPCGNNFDLCYECEDII